MSENTYLLNSLENQAYCAACDGELKTGARFCSRCGQPATEAISVAVNNSLFDRTTRRLAIPDCKARTVKARSRKTQPLKSSPRKQRGYQLLAVSLAANCVLVMAFALAVSRVGFPSQDNVSPLIAEFVAPEDREIFFDSAFETSIEEIENADEKRVACEATPAPEAERTVGAVQISGVRGGKDETAAVKKSVTIKGERAWREMRESQPNARQSNFVREDKARRNAQNEAPDLKVLATFNNEELREAAADFNFEMSRLLPAALQTEWGKAEVKEQKEIERANRKAMHEQRKRSVRRAVITRGAEFVTVSCVTVPDAAPNAAPEAPIVAPTFVIKAETVEGLGF